MPIKTPTKKINIHAPKYKPIMPVTAYRYARAGMVETDIYIALGFSTMGWHFAKKRHPELVEALRLGRADTEDGGTWHKFVYDRLPENLRELWDKIESWSDLPNGMAKIEALLADHGKTVRQQLYLHALVQYNFSPSRAMQKVNIPRSVLVEWISGDPEFGELVEQIEWHKDNFFEESLINLVKAGDAGATLAAVRSRLKNRGYGIKSEVNINHSGEVNHNFVDLTELDLSMEVRRAILDAIRGRENKILEDKNKVTITAEARLIQEIHHVPEETGVDP